MLTAGQYVIVVAWKWLNPVHILSAKANTYTRWLCVGGLKLHPNRTFRNKKRSIKRPIGDEVCVVVLTDQGVVSRTNFSSDHGSFHVCPSGCLALRYTTVSFIFLRWIMPFSLPLSLFPDLVLLRDKGRDTKVWDCCCFVVLCLNAHIVSQGQDKLSHNATVVVRKCSFYTWCFIPRAFLHQSKFCHP